MQTVTIDLIPQDVLPIIKVSQFNDNWDIKFIITENGEEKQIHPADVCTCVIRKPDNNIVTIEASTLYDNGVKISLTEQACACYGKALGELVIIATEGGVTKRVGSCNFILDVEISPELGGIRSASEIDNLESQIEAIVTEVLSDDYYTKTETDILLSAKANASDVYTKAQADTLLSAKANASDVYTKPQADTLLSAKANASDVYTKTQIDNIILDIMPVDTATGDPATFDTEIAAPLVNVSCDVVATGGGGTPSTPVPIVGYSQANITANGNVITIAFGQTVYGGVLDVTRGKLHVTCAINEDMSDLSWLETSTTHVFYTGVSGKKAGYTSFLLCEQYTKYEGYVSGIGNNQISSNASLEYIYVRNDDCTTVSDITTALNGCKLVYELTTPFDIDLTPEAISAIVGTNNVNSDTNGDTTVQFKDSIQHYIDKH